MSGGKKKHPKKRMYSEWEVRKAIKEAADDSVKRIMLICLAAADDMFKPDEDGMVEFMQTMARYIKYQEEGKVDLNAYSKSLLNNCGIDLKLTRW